MSGVVVPKLGSIQDIMSRNYLTKRANKDIAFNKILAHLAIFNSGNKENEKNISSMWSSYVSAACYLEDEIEARELHMEEEFKYWKTLTPKLYKNEEGHVMVSGITLPKEIK